MSSVVFRVIPLSKLHLAKAEAHNRRITPESSIDPDRSHLNMCLHGSMHVESDVEAVLAQYDKPQSKVVCAEVLLTAGADFFNEISPDWRQGPDFFSDAMKAWVKLNQEAMHKKFGKGLASMHLHLDEEAPHIHAFVVPLSTYEINTGRAGKAKKEVTRVMYSKVFGDTMQVLKAARISQRSDTDTKLGMLQTWYADAMKSTGLERGIRNSSATHTTIKEYQKRLKATDKDPKNLAEALPKAKEYDRIKAEVDRLKIDLIAKDKIIKSLDAHAAKSISVAHVLKSIDAIQSSKNEWITTFGAVAVDDRQRWIDLETEQSGSGAIEFVQFFLTKDGVKTTYANAIRWLKEMFGISRTLADALERTREKVLRITEKESDTGFEVRVIEATKAEIAFESSLTANANAQRHSKIIKNKTKPESSL
jgi:transposase-like protein